MYLTVSPSLVRWCNGTGHPIRPLRILRVKGKVTDSCLVTFLLLINTVAALDLGSLHLVGKKLVVLTW